MEKSQRYVKLVGYVCCNPDCKSGFNVEGHHIIPKKNGGADEYWNLISICRKCHRGKELHKNWREKSIELFMFKTHFEMEKWGFVLDEHNSSSDNIDKMLHKSRASTKEQFSRQPHTTEKGLIKTIRKKAKSTTERKLAEEYNVTRGDINRLKKGIAPKGNSKRSALNLPPIKTIIVCHICKDYPCICSKKKNDTFNPFIFIYQNILSSYNKVDFITKAKKLTNSQRQMVAVQYRVLYLRLKRDNS